MREDYAVFTWMNLDYALSIFILRFQWLAFQSLLSLSIFYLYLNFNDIYIVK